MSATSPVNIVVTRYRQDGFAAEVQVRPPAWDHHAPDGSPPLFRSRSTTPFLDCEAWIRGNNLTLNSALWT